MNEMRIVRLAKSLVKRIQAVKKMASNWDALMYRQYNRANAFVGSLRWISIYAYACAWKEYGKCY